MKGKRCFLGLDMKMTELRKRQRPGEPIIWLAVSIFVFVILFILPFIYDHYYFNILETKYYTYCIAAAALIFIWLVYALLQLGKKKPGNVSFNLKVFSAADGFLLLFLLVSLVSTIFSSYSYEAFWGNEGRYTGLFFVVIIRSGLLYYQPLWTPDRTSYSCISGDGIVCLYIWHFRLLSNGFIRV